jgi:hypothetical protein
MEERQWQVLGFKPPIVDGLANPSFWLFYILSILFAPLFLPKGVLFNDNCQLTFDSSLKLSLMMQICLIQSPDYKAEINRL